MTHPSYTPPNRLVVHLTEGADAIKRRYPEISLSGFGPEQIAKIIDPTTDRVWGYVVVDKLIRGDTSIGGNRHKPDLTLVEVANLAREMTLKNAAARLGIAGGKSGIIVDPDYFKCWDGESSDSPSYQQRLMEKRDLMEKCAEAIAYLYGYTIAPDMGTDGDDMEHIYNHFKKMFGNQHCRGGIGRKSGIDIDRWGCTAYGLLVAAQVAEKYVPGVHLDGARVSINGYGNVGRYAAEFFARCGAKIIAVNDYHGVLYNKEGLDLNVLSEVGNGENGIMDYDGEAEKWDARCKERDAILGELFKIPCDILIPAAVRDVIHENNVQYVDAKVILEGANGPVSSKLEKRLFENKRIVSISDFIANSGGVIAAFVELEMDRDPIYAERVQKKDGTGREYITNLISSIIGENVTEIFDRISVANKQNNVLYFRDEAIALAEQYLTCPTLIKDVRL